MRSTLNGKPGSLLLAYQYEGIMQALNSLRRPRAWGDGRPGAPVLGQPCLRTVLGQPISSDLRPAAGRQGRRTRASAADGALLVADGLPIAAVLPDILRGLQASSCLVLQAPPGAGKTTAVPLAMLLSSPEYLAAGKKVLVLEPRRVAAKAAARRMASMLGERVGGRVGYRVRLDTRVSKATRVEVRAAGAAPQTPWFLGTRSTP